ncbi:peptidoglycan-binding domain-containing protein [Micromonospora sp. DT233]|uniref:peptidoglycan-binding domain-containing protein n=1 Tax=Micromonospora sp. DT233 TaxID=3393432 RepID=UPI003CF858AA
MAPGTKAMFNVRIRVFLDRKAIHMLLRIRAVAAVAVAVTGGALAVSAAPAVASVSQGYITGSGDWRDDWGDEGPVSASTRSHNNVVGAWQTILWADGYLTQADVDCRFGSATTAATKEWQSDRGLVSDGVVGAQTLAKAATKLDVYEQEGWYWYDGAGSNFIYFGRHADGKWDMSLPSGETRLLSYTSASICS